MSLNYYQELYMDYKRERERERERERFFSDKASIKTYTDRTALYAQTFTAQISSGVHFTVFSLVRFHLTGFACNSRIF